MAGAGPEMGADCGLLTRLPGGVPVPYRLFRLAPADVAALAAAASLLTPVLIVAFYLGAKLLSRLLGPLLMRGRYYPFMPVVSLATGGVLGLALIWQATHGRPLIDSP